MKNSERISRRALLAALGAASVLSACSIVPPRRAAGGWPAGPVADPTADPAADPGLAQGRIADELAREASLLALSLVDTPYRYGGNTPESGFDCSGLIVYVYRHAARLRLPRTVAELARTGVPVPLAAARSGDLVLFDTQGRFSHAGIYVDGGRFVHAPSTGGTVRLDGVQARYWAPRFSGVRRI